MYRKITLTSETDCQSNHTRLGCTQRNEKQVGRRVALFPIRISNILRRITAISAITLLGSCSTFNSNEEKPTLSSLDKPFQNTIDQPKSVAIKPKSEQEVRNAYTRYLSNTRSNDKTRQNAINRLAELEFEVSNKLLQQKEQTDDNSPNLDDQAYLEKLNKSIELFNLSLNDYPDAKGNDNILYQLARAYDHKGDYASSIESLTQLINNYPESNYYIEAQFRIAEARFSETDYIAAEDAYTEVIISQNNDLFYERALFKRGWARFKQSLYEDSIDDYFQAISYHNFEDTEQLNQSEKERFEEYFRAVGLSFSNLGGANALNQFFQDNSEFEYLFYTYSVVSDIFLKQERYSDAAEVLEQFILSYPTSKDIPFAHLNTVKVWQKSNFLTKLNKAIESFFVSYSDSSQYWTNHKHPDIQKSISQSLREYTLLMSEYYHSQYQTTQSGQKKSTKQSLFNGATKWYRRYLSNFSAYARQDNIYYRYAQLLAAENKTFAALEYYERAAYDGDLVLDKKSAYATILLTDQLNQKLKKQEARPFLEKHINYSLLFAQLYPKDKRTEDIIVHAAELAYNSKKYETTVELANLLSQEAKANSRYSANLLRAQAHFNLGQFPESENIYTGLLSGLTLSSEDRRLITDRLALSIYEQANQFKKQNKVLEAGNEFTRIAEVAPSSDIAATGLYDAIALYSSHKLWDQTITSVKRFQNLFKTHKYNKEVTKTLSVAYLNSNQSAKAAEQFEKISTFEQDRNVKMTALWQAAELYESNKNYSSAIRSYRDYANNYKKPYAQYIESMVKLTELYSKTNQLKNLDRWRNQIIKADKNAKQQEKTDRTQYVASMATLNIARNKNQVFNQLKLVAPLKSNLRKKKKAMQETIKLFGQASSYGISEITTESTFAIAQIYQDFSQALLNSERPKSLSEDELEQYDILLEDQAFPFEDKAIEFYEINMSRIKDGLYDDWVDKSLSKLKLLFPVKYNRKSKIDGFIETVQ